MTTPATQWQRLDDCVARELDASQRLLDTLREENAALATCDAGRIEQAADAKRCALCELEALDREREQLMRESDQIADPIMNADPRRHSRLLDNWMRLLELAGECQRQNNINGALIQSGLRHTRQVLSLLKGQPAADASQYGPGGTTAPPAWGRNTLGKV
jgi:flagellar biosynthesis/type III secretory pathway chaperone